MSIVIVGLGNPDTEYKGTRHNVGRAAVQAFAKKFDFNDFEFDKKSNALISEGKVGKAKMILVLPETFMNKSGESVRKYVKSVKAAAELVVVHDDLDIALGKAKMSFNKSSGGHRGVQSVINHLKTESFYRIRIGISPSTAKGVIKKPSGADLIDNFIVASFKPKEVDELKSINKKIVECLETSATDSFARAMGELNGAF
jgi:PTH1 family peptidyl-tRNA hydrolase